jgi:ribosomal protein L21E
MNQKKFKAEVLSGHKEDAVEVPFDPAKEWGIPPKPLWRGRRGHVVNATVNGFSFESSIVPRQKKFYLLINAEAAESAGVSEGVVVRVAVEPCVE